MARLSPYFAYKRDPAGGEYLEVYLRGNPLLRMAATNKGTAFTQRERLELGLEGMLPPSVCSLEQQVARLYRGYCHNDVKAMGEVRQQFIELRELVVAVAAEKHPQVLDRGSRLAVVEIHDVQLVAIDQNIAGMKIGVQDMVVDEAGQPARGQGVVQEVNQAVAHLFSQPFQIFSDEVAR